MSCVQVLPDKQQPDAPFPLPREMLQHSESGTVHGSFAGRSDDSMLSDDTFMISEWGDAAANLQRASAGVVRVHTLLQKAALVAPSSPSKIACMRLLAKVLFVRKHPRAELKVLRDLAEELRRLHPAPGHPDALNMFMVMRRIGTCLLSLGEKREAVSQLRICIKAADRLLLSHQVIEVQIARVMLATCIVSPEDVDKTLQYLDDLPDVQRHVGYSPMVRNAFVVRAQCFRYKKRLAEAVDGYKMAASLFKEAGQVEQSEALLHEALKVQDLLLKKASKIQKDEVRETELFKARSVVDLPER
jgi:hypothetical protein